MAFDDPNLVSSAGLVPVLALAEQAGLRLLADEHLSVPNDKGANSGLKVASIVAGMVAGADSIDDMALLRHGGMGKLFSRAYAPSTLGSFLRSFTFGHVRQLDAVASRFLAGLAKLAPILATPADGTGTSLGWAVLDVDDTIIEVHGYAKQGVGFGYNKLRGLNALLATLATSRGAPVIVAQLLRKGSTGSPRGAARLVADAARTASRLLPGGTPVLVRADSAFYGRGPVRAALTGGAAVSVTVRMDPRVKATIASIDADTWTSIEYPHPVFEEASGQWVSRAEVAETSFVAFTSAPKAQQVPGRLVVRRIPDLNTETKKAAGQDTLFDAWRFSSVFFAGLGMVILLVKRLLATARDPVSALTPRELEVLQLIAEGRSNTNIAELLTIGTGAVEKNISAIFAKLGLTDSPSGNRRVLAVLAHLQRA